MAVFRPNQYDSNGVRGGYSHPTERRLYFRAGGKVFAPRTAVPAPSRGMNPNPPRSAIHRALAARPPHEAQQLANRMKLANPTSGARYGAASTRRAIVSKLNEYNAVASAASSGSRDALRAAVPAKPRLRKASPKAPRLRTASPRLP